MIPAATTTVTFAHELEPEPGEGATIVTHAAGVRAVVSGPSGLDLQQPGGGTETISAVLIADPTLTVDHRDRVTTAEGDVYEIAWVVQRIGFGLDHTRAGLIKVTR